ncbi:unnamed protein product [Parnassius apollo]|uniref:(apollo) hypothetical protein n=1 Tax=Parnassius apollo TaxID=110799 RepID=A0A8S3WFZ8_PARAO|nr:unnamed protein product [Parnassius apollo]
MPMVTVATLPELDAAEALLELQGEMRELQPERFEFEINPSRPQCSKNITKYALLKKQLPVWFQSVYDKAGTALQETFASKKNNWSSRKKHVGLKSLLNLD